jgi:hypothetical protein
LRNHRNQQRKLALQEPRLIPPIRSPALASLRVCRLRSAERWTIAIADRVPFGRRSRVPIDRRGSLAKNSSPKRSSLAASDHNDAPRDACSPMRCYGIPLSGMPVCPQ